MIRRFAWIFVPLALVWGGGFFLVVHNHDGVLTVEAQGCHDYSHAAITGQAEGIVNGKRRSVRLELTPTSQPGIYSVPKSWPSEGRWVLVFSGTSGGLHTHTLLEVAADGTSQPRMSMKPVSAEEIEAALR
jgi:hypothetical protein